MIDVSRSMLASRTPSSPRRIARARADAIRLRQSLLDVPSGVAALTDHVLPYLMPVPDAATFEQTVNAGGRGRPAAAGDELRDGDEPRLARCARDAELLLPGAPSTASRSCSPTASRGRSTSSRPRGRSGRSRRSSSGSEARTRASTTRADKPESGYHPDPSAGLTLGSLAQAAGGKAFGEGQLGAGGERCAGGARARAGARRGADGEHAGARRRTSRSPRSSRCSRWSAAGWPAALRAARGTREREGTRGLPSRSASPARS